MLRARHPTQHMVPRHLARSPPAHWFNLLSAAAAVVTTSPGGEGGAGCSNLHGCKMTEPHRHRPALDADMHENLRLRPVVDLTAKVPASGVDLSGSWLLAPIMEGNIAYLLHSFNVDYAP